ncbi:hypothetical protein F7725_001213, partial [Dissostichus mawsoni]
MLTPQLSFFLGTLTVAVTTTDGYSRTEDTDRLCVNRLQVLKLNADLLLWVLLVLVLLLRSKHWGLTFPLLTHDAGIRLEYLVELQLVAELGQSGIQELVLLCGLDHTTSAQDGGKKQNVNPRSRDKNLIKHTDRRERRVFPTCRVGADRQSPDVELPGVSELLTADTADDETPGPADTCTERRGEVQTRRLTGENTFKTLCSRSWDQMLGGGRDFLYVSTSSTSLSRGAVHCGMWWSGQESGNHDDDAAPLLPHHVPEIPHGGPRLCEEEWSGEGAWSGPREEVTFC